ncbi:TetR/AcrR family transcriptional regulator [Brevibacterium sp. UMB1308A]|uniref:TetR/AcrR family transcriptional regulator n=1 Tax=Brevibacterium sp. UMB1308A TaxID=3050608 RepID=UPI00254C7544|nr:TetR/AcrR family transcriptional regulator [Brevibacterium sp. UMB1308A]MDK8345705.1 TetR/AcrR family transcriptional regulator [Brevibacterium sp. UMB1308B]MDK8713144.1 TetR/AcrR family transcriptional regulator [Brevibacterium sp. UMB1308A]
MTSQKRMPRAQRRSQLLSVSTEVFARQGYHATSMDNIALEAGVSKPILYQHFESKHELFTTIMDSAIEELAERLTTTLETVDSREERVHQSFYGYFEFVKENRSAFIVMSRTSSELSDARTRWSRAVDTYVEIISESIRDRNNLDDVQAYVMGRAIAGMAEQASQVCIDYDDVDVEEVARLTAKMAFEGLSGVEKSQFTLTRKPTPGQHSS